MSNDEKMNIDERRRYLRLIRPRYRKAGRKEKEQLLNEMVAVTGPERKTLIDRKYGSSFDQVTAGIEVLKTTHSAPKANAICERFLGSLRRECLDYFLIPGEKHLYRVVKEYKRYFNRARPHQGIEQRIPCQPERLETPPTNRILVSRPVPSGLHHDYGWQGSPNACLN